MIIFFATIAFIGLILFPDSLANEKSKKHGLFFNIAVQVRKIVGIRKLLTTQNGEFTPVIMLLIAFVFGTIADQFGFHPAIGAYFAGLFLKGEYFNVHIDNTLKSHKKEAKKVIDHLAFTIFGPIFFIMLGSKLIFEFDILSKVVVPVFILFSLVFVLQIVSASIAARYTGRYEGQSCRTPPGLHP